MTIAKRLVTTLLLVVALGGLEPSPACAAPAPSSAEPPVALVNATVHSAAGPPLAHAMLVARGGRIVFVGQGSPPADATVVDVGGAHVYPSLIEADSTLGLQEVEAVRATRDITETGSMNANLRADEAFHPDSQLLPVAMSAGILVAATSPRGSGISGRAAVMQLSGWNRDDMTLRAPAGLMVQWPSTSIHRGPDARPTVAEQEKSLRRSVREIREAFENARAYAQARKASPTVPRDVMWEAMQDALEGRIPVFVRAQRVDEIEGALQLAREQHLRLVVVGGGDAWRVADRLAQQRAGVIYTEVTRLPGRDCEPYDVHFRAPSVLARAGVAVAISSGRSAADVRNLSDFAGRASAFGLSGLEALRAITIVPAQLLGVADRVGSLEPGKDATFFVADGDILDTRTHVLRAWVKGREVSLQDRQKSLYERYRRRPSTRP